MELLITTMIVLFALQLLLVLWAWYDIFHNKNLSQNFKAIYALLIFVLPFLGPLVYFFVKGRQIRNRNLFREE